MARLILNLFLIQFIFIAIISGLFQSKKLKHPSKYELKQKVLTIGSSYIVKDDHGQSAYKIGFKKLGLGKHLQLTDANGQHEYYAIKHILNPFGLAKYEILENDKVIADVKRKMNILGGKKFQVTSKRGTFKIEGNFRSREFKITKDRHLVATISKKFFSIGDTYGVKIEQGQDVPFILALAIVVDEVAHG